MLLIETGMIVKAAISWLTQLSDLIVCNIVDVIVAEMTGNPTFPLPLPAIPEVVVANDAAKAAIVATANGDRVSYAIKDAKMAELAAVVRPLAYYVTITSGGDMAKLLSSGFPIQQPTRQKIGPLPTPTAPVAEPGSMHGTVHAATEAIHGTYIYRWRAATVEAPTLYVAEMQTTKANALLTGLTRGGIYNIQVSAVGAAGPTEWSNAANIVAP